jgi:hypothetical protein
MPTIIYSIDRTINSRLENSRNRSQALVPRIQWEPFEKLERLQSRLKVRN